MLFLDFGSFSGGDKDFTKTSNLLFACHPGNRTSYRCFLFLVNHFIEAGQQQISNYSVALITMNTFKLPQSLPHTDFVVSELTIQRYHDTRRTRVIRLQPLTGKVWNSAVHLPT
ncbi:hypothetical protein SAMN04488582_103447 [Mycobacterium sp. 455mf]|nr:hypothetical protein SAMN04488582_103447 [Mycobacterium sp. 455mf]